MKCLLWNWIWLASLPGIFLLIQAEGNRIPTPPPHSAFRHPQTGQNLEILQLSPGGPVTDPPNLSVSFSQPMVTFTGLKRQSQPPTGVTLTPQPAGSWFWIGPKTLVFEPETFFPMATVYQVNIGREVRSMAGNQLSTPVVWTFSTPELCITEDNADIFGYSHNQHIYLEFNQRIDPAALLPFLTVVADHQTFPVRLASPEAITDDQSLTQLRNHAGSGRWIVLQTNGKLPGDSTFQVHLKAGAPSAEGPLSSQHLQVRTFHTLRPMQLVESDCGGNLPCDPMDWWILRFSNNIDQTTFRPEMISIAPPVEGISIDQTNHEILICCGVPEKTTYQVTISPELCDEFGQPLEQPTIVNFTVGKNDPYLFIPDSGLVTLDPAHKAELPIYTCGVESVNIEVYDVTLADWPAFQRFQASVCDDTFNVTQSASPWKLVETRWVDTRGGQANNLKQTLIDLTQTLATGLGHRIVVIQAAENQFSADTCLKQAVWVQAARMAKEMMVPENQAGVQVTSLLDGRPVPATQRANVPEQARQETGTVIRSYGYSRGVGSAAPYLWLSPRPKLDDVVDTPVKPSPESRSREYTRLKVAFSNQGVVREFKAVDDPADVRQVSSNEWDVRTGARMKVRLRFVVITPSLHLELIDQLPAGLQGLNAAEPVTRDRSAKPNGGSWAATWFYGRNWFKHQLVESNRVEGTGPLLLTGVYEYAFYAQATVPGTIVVPAPQIKTSHSQEATSFNRNLSTR